MVILFSKKNILSIAYESNVVRIVQGLFVDGKYKIDKADTYSIPKNLYDDGRIINTESFSEFMQQMLKNGSFDAKKAVINLNSDEIIVKEINIPMVTEDEMKSIVDFRASDILQDRYEHFVVDYLSIKKSIIEGQEKNIILIIAMPKEMVMKQLTVLDSMRIVPIAMDYRPNAISKYLNTIEYVDEIHVIKNKAIATLDFGNNYTTISVSKDGILEMTKRLGYGVETLKENIKQIFEYEESELLNNILNMQNISEEYYDFSDESRLINAVKSSLSSLLIDVQQLLRFYNSRSGGNNVQYVVKIGSMFKINGINEYISGFLEIPVIGLVEQKYSDTTLDPSLYAAALGGFIRLEEEK